MRFSIRKIFGGERPPESVGQHDTMVTWSKFGKGEMEASLEDIKTEPDHLASGLSGNEQPPEKESSPELKKRVTIGIENSAGLSVDIKTTVIDPLLVVLREKKETSDAKMIKDLYDQAEKRALEGADATTASKTLISMIEAIAKRRDIDLNQFLS